MPSPAGIPTKPPTGCWTSSGPWTGCCPPRSRSWKRWRAWARGRRYCCGSWGLSVTGPGGRDGRKRSWPPWTRPGAYFLRLLDGQRTEQLYQLCVDAKGKVLSCRMLSQGQSDMTVLSLRQVVENALLSGASGVFLGHNHPSGVALPSPADMEATTQVRDALKRLDIRLIDHIIVADGDYVSMASSGLLR